MTNNNLRRAGVILFTLTLAFLIAVPTGAAQSAPKVNLLAPTGIDTPLVAEVDTKSLKVPGTYVIETDAQTLAGAIGSVQITWEFDCGSYDSVMTITGPTTTIHTIAAQEKEVDIDTTFQVSMTRDAPALRGIECEVSATASAVEDRGLPAPDGPGKAKFQVKAQYYALVEATVNRKLGQSGPQKQIPFQIDVNNFSNGETKVIFGVENEPGGKWQHILPDQLILNSPKMSGQAESGSRTFEVATPFKNGWNNEEGAYTITLTPEYSFKTDDAQVGTPIQINVLARVRGVYVPTLEPMLMLGAIIGTAFVARMGRDDE